MPLSIWEKQSFYFHSDVLIVGAGLTGLLTSIFIKKNSPSTLVRIIEKGMYPSGASVKNAGFACFGSVSEILDDIESEGKTKAYERIAKRYSGLQKLKSIIDPKLFDWEPNGAYEIFTQSEKELQKECFEAIESINSELENELGSMLFEKSSKDFGMECLVDSIYTKKEASINTGKLMHQLIEKAKSLGVVINFGAELINYTKNGASWLMETETTSYTSEKIVFATNGFSKQFLDVDIEPGRGQIVLSSPIPNLKLKGNFHLHKGYFYFRNFEGRVLLGGGRHLDVKNENTLDQNTSPKIQNVLEELLRNSILPNIDFQIENRWAGTMAFGSKNEKEIINKDMGNGVFLAARFGGMGLALSSHEAELMALKVISK